MLRQKRFLNLIPGGFRSCGMITFAPCAFASSRLCVSHSFFRIGASCALLFVLAAPPGAAAKLCGDDVRGQDVACACGDTVVSDLVLNGDPVAGAPCSADGLIVDAKGMTHGVTVDLRGRTLRGTGQGAGLWLRYGGPGGARVISSDGVATIDGFRDGVVAHGNDSVALIDSVAVANSGRDGVRVQTNNVEMRSVESRAAAARSQRRYRPISSACPRT